MFKVSKPNPFKTFNRCTPFKTLQSNAVQKHAPSLIEGFKVRFKVKFGEGNFHVSGILETTQ